MGHFVSLLRFVAICCTCSLYALCAPSGVSADGASGDRLAYDSEVDQSAGPASADAPESIADRADHDRRLPPVLPGQSVNGGSMKVWSTAGGSSVREPPQAPRASQPEQESTGIQGTLGAVDAAGIGVIVDQRRRGNSR